MLNISYIKLPKPIRGRDYLPVRSGRLEPEVQDAALMLEDPEHVFIRPRRYVGGFSIGRATYRRLRRHMREPLPFVINMEDGKRRMEFTAIITDCKPIERFFERFDGERGCLIVVRRIICWISVEMVGDGSMIVAA